MYALILVLVSSASVQCLTSPQAPNVALVGKIVKECVGSSAQISCFADRISKGIERSMDWDVTLFDGVKFLRNKQQQLVPAAEPRAPLLPFDRLLRSARDFLDTHYFSVDLTEDDQNEARRGGGGGGHGGGGGGDLGFGYSKQALKKERKYMQYAFMVLLGIFGLTGPLVMKTLGVMAAKALIASKVALIVVGSVALKKIFEKDHEKTSVKVHNIHSEDEHDRIYAPSKVVSPYWSYSPYYSTPT